MLGNQPDRPTLLADAAIRVVATKGLRGLTHRAVDETAGLPPGSTSNIFRTRSALVGAVAERLEELDQAVMARERATGTDLEEVLAAMARHIEGVLLHAVTVRANQVPDAAELTRTLRRLIEA